MICIYCKHSKVEGDNNCGNCGARFTTSETEWIITDYFRKGFTYNEILDLLAVNHNLKMSLRTLKSYLNQYGLKRKNLNGNLDLVRNTLKEEIKGSSSQFGYRTMGQHLRQNRCIHVPRDIIMKLMHEIDPDGVAIRKSRRLQRRKYHSLGPNDCWHADGYDKLKPYGFPIHGCIDGFSRKILWLELVKSNNNPYTVAPLFLKTVEAVKFVPKRLRTDCGTENGVMAAAQSFLRRNHEDSYSGSKAHLYGSSHLNQRIEAWWSIFRKTKSGYIINFFKKIIQDGSYNPDDDLQKACAWFCFAPLIKDELSQCKELWNSHYIRKSQYSDVPGRPDHLFFSPQHEYSNQGIPYSVADLNHLNTMSTEWATENEIDELYAEYFNLLAYRLNLQKPSSFDSAFEMFQSLMDNAQ